MKKTLIIIGLLICTSIFLWLGVNALDAAFMEYTGFTAVVSFLASLVYFIFGYKGCSLIVHRLTKWLLEEDEE